VTSLSAGPEIVAIPGPSVMPERVLNAMHRSMPDIYSGEIFAATDDLSVFEELQGAAICDVVVKSDAALEALARSALEVMGIEREAADAAVEAAHLVEAEQLVRSLG